MLDVTTEEFDYAMKRGSETRRAHRKRDRLPSQAAERENARATQRVAHFGDTDSFAHSALTPTIERPNQRTSCELASSSATTEARVASGSSRVTSRTTRSKEAMRKRRTSAKAPLVVGSSGAGFAAASSSSALCWLS